MTRHGAGNVSLQRRHRLHYRPSYRDAAAPALADACTPAPRVRCWGGRGCGARDEPQTVAPSSKPRLLSHPLSSSLDSQVGRWGAEKPTFSRRLESERKMGVVTGERQEGEAHVRGRDAPRRPCSRDLGTHFLFSPFSPGSGSVDSHLDQGMLSHHKRLSSSKTINAQGLGVPLASSLPVRLSSWGRNE